MTSMPATKRFIEDMVKGGWKPKTKRVMVYAGCNSEYSIWNFAEGPNKGSSICEIHEKALLDPKAFQAVGKVRGWSKPQMLKSVYEDEGLKLEATGFFAQQLLFIAYLAEGKTKEEALQAIE